MKILSATNINKSFLKGTDNKVSVLRDLSLSINENEITVIVGSSGAGKSTLLHILSGLDSPDSGEVLIDRKNIFTLSESEITKFRNNSIGFIYQFHHLLPEFTAVENVAIAKMINGTSKKEALNKSAEILGIVGLAERINHKPAELSGGEQQRVAIARALINNPKLIFADEPTGNLDSKTGKEIMKLLRELNKNKNLTFIIVTHDDEIAKNSDRIIKLKDGKTINDNSNMKGGNKE
jgi:lipoprotein-releasing system ATP-binding protein